MKNLVATIGLLIGIAVAAGFVSFRLGRNSDVRDALAKINDPEGTPIYATVDDFAQAYHLLQEDLAIAYHGASGSTNYDSVGDAHPALVHWKVDQQHFIESEDYDCSTDPLCPPNR